MIKITPRAADQIKKAAQENQITHTPCLRIAVRLQENGSFDYGLGFDERKDDDVHLSSEGVDVVFATHYKELLMGAVLDYVELNPGEHRFILNNPNDPAHKPVDEKH